MVAGWAIPRLLMPQNPGFALVCALVALQETLMFGLPALIYFMAQKRRGDKASSLFALPSAYPIGLTLLSAVSFVLAGSLLTYLNMVLLSNLGIPVPAPVVPVPNNQMEWLLSIFCMALVPAFTEEAFFRGAVLHIIKARFGPRAALWGSSLVFAALHLDLVAFPTLLVIGLLLGRLRQKSSGLLLPVLFHFTYNAMVLTLNMNKASPSASALMLCVLVFYVATRFLLKEEGDDPARSGV